MTESHENNLSGPDNTGTAPAPQPAAPQPPAAELVPLAPKVVWRWGAAGGLASVLAANGLFDLKNIEAMLNGSEPAVQITTLIFLGIVTAGVGGLWARAHKPIHSVMVAFQLGILAPAAINALIATAAANSGQETGFNFMDELFISTAHADNRLAVQEKPTTFECIILTIIKKPC